MSRKGNAYVLACGCRFFEGQASMCEEHVYDRSAARRTLAMSALIAVVAGFLVGVLMLAGCTVDTSGTGVTDAATSEDATLSRGDSGVRGMDSGVVPDTGLPEAPDTVDADAGQGELGPMGTVVDSGVPDVATDRCPKPPTASGCASGSLSFVSGVTLTCCVPVDWEGYRQHCPQPFEGCRWKWAIFDGWTGECCG